MIWIDLEDRQPTDTDIPGWKPWTREHWDAWQAKSHRLVAEMAVLEAAGDRVRRNKLIDANDDHWKALREWLLALSSGKCWFSETRDLFSHYDVEHFRPKKQARELDGTYRDGYWWLTFDYRNFRVCGTVGNRKKGGWFPLQHGSRCSTFAAPCEELESCYLIDPINAADVALLAFDEEGKVIPAPEASDWEKERVRQTVERLKLNEHVPLAEARRKVWQRVDKAIADYQISKARARGGDNPVATDRLQQVCREIRGMTRPTEELSAVARWCILFRNDPQLSRLVG